MKRDVAYLRGSARNLTLETIDDFESFRDLIFIRNSKFAFVPAKRKVSIVIFLSSNL